MFKLLYILSFVFHFCLAEIHRGQKVRQCFNSCATWSTGRFQTQEEKQESSLDQEWQQEILSDYLFKIKTPSKSDWVRLPGLGIFSVFEKKTCPELSPS